MPELDQLLQHARDGDADMQFAVANVYHLGLLDQEADFIEALRWYELAARQDHADAQINLALLHLNEIPDAGGPRKVAVARSWLEKAATQGDAGAMYDLGCLHLTEEDAPRDVRLALVWLEQAAEAGHGGAFMKLGLLYDEGELVRRDADKADRFYRQGLAAIKLREAGAASPRSVHRRSSPPAFPRVPH